MILINFEILLFLKCVWFNQTFWGHLKQCAYIFFFCSSDLHNIIHVIHMVRCGTLLAQLKQMKDNWLELSKL